MPIRTNLKNLVPRRERYKKEITLMSGGFSNPAAFPGGKLTVYPWDHEADDLMLESARNGDSHMVGIQRLLTHLCNLNGCRVDDFVASEVNTVLLVARSIQAGGTLHYTSLCPACGHKEAEEIVVPEELETKGVKGVGYPGYDDIVLPETQDIVRIRPLLIKDENILAARTKEAEDEVKSSTLRVLMGIVTVGGGKPELLTELVQWYAALPPIDVNYLKTQQEELSPHLNSGLKHRCDKCRFEFTHTLLFDREFFRPSLPAKSGGQIPADVRSGVGQPRIDGKPD